MRAKINNSSKRLLLRRASLKYRLKKQIPEQRIDAISARLNSIQNDCHENDAALCSSESVNHNSLLIKLQCWATDHKITTRAINDLLKLLIGCGFKWLPADYRSFLGTPRNIEINSVADGMLWYNGIAKNLYSIFSTINRDIVISLNINVDGLPLFKSSKTQFWPILVSIHGEHCLCSNITYIFQFNSLLS